MNRISTAIIAIFMAILILSCGGGSAPGQQPEVIEPTIPVAGPPGQQPEVIEQTAASAATAAVKASATGEASAEGRQVELIAEMPVDLSGTSQELLGEASLRAAFGDISAMLIAVKEAESFDPEHEIFNSPEIWEQVCRLGIFEREPDMVWTACDRALVEAGVDTSDPSALTPYYDLRGIASALAGATENAVADFQFTVNNSDDGREIEIHESWISILLYGVPDPEFEVKIPEEASRWNRACWFGSLRGLASLALPACELAVELAEENQLGPIRDSRGVARALTGDAQGAIADFEVYVAQFAADDEYLESVARRQEWIEALRQGRQPLDQKTLDFLVGD